MPAPKPIAAPAHELVVITGLSGSGKGTVLKTLEDCGYYAVDNLPLGLIPQFAELTRDSPNIHRAALAVDVREGRQLEDFPKVYRSIPHSLRKRLIFIDADDATLVRRYSETRRPHPLGEASVLRSVRAERRALAPIRAMADDVVETSALNAHQLRRHIVEKFGQAAEPGAALRIAVVSFGFRHGLPPDADLVFDVRFLPNPNYIPEFKNQTGRNRSVARYIRSFPQTAEFMDRAASLLDFLLPHYIAEGKSYLTIAFGCTGGHHRSVMMAEDTAKRLRKSGFAVRLAHRDIER